MATLRFPAEGEILSRATVRLVIEPGETERFDARIEADHYLKSARYAGQVLRYVVEVDGQWVALVVYGASAWHLKARDQFLRWTPRQRARRLSLVVSNVRFLLLSDRGRYPNMASKALALTLRRLSDDWLERWGHPVLAVESFVDESRYPGTCYKACGFQALGNTTGFSRTAKDFYTPNGQPKALYFRVLHPRGAALLRQSRWPKELLPYEEKISGPCPLRASGLHTLREVFRSVPDTHRGHGLYHVQCTVLACAAVAVLLGAGGYEAMASTCSKFTQRQLAALGCRRHHKTRLFRGPSGTTFFRILHRLEAEDFERRVGLWMQAQETAELEALAADGKVLRGSGRQDGKPLQLLSAVSHRLRLTLGQEPIEEKSNEIPALIPLLRRIAPPPGTIVTADALHCQQESARFITQELGGDYLFGLKGNQSGILQTAETLLKRQGFPPCGSSGLGESSRPIGTSDGRVAAGDAGASGVGGVLAVFGDPTRATGIGR